MIASNTIIPDPVAWYSSHAASLAPVYEVIDPAKGYAWLAELMPTVPASRWPQRGLRLLPLMAVGCKKAIRFHWSDGQLSSAVPLASSPSATRRHPT
jgi:hypothetical protein